MPVGPGGFFRGVGAGESESSAPGDLEAPTLTDQIKEGAIKGLLSPNPILGPGAQVLSGETGSPGWLSTLTTAIARGMFTAVLIIVRAILGYGPLRMADFMAGYYWELTRLILGFAEKSKLTGDYSFALPGADETTEEAADDSKSPRIWILIFIFLTYYLAFGRDKGGIPNIESAAQNFAGIQRNTGEKETATVQVSRKAITVARKRIGKTTRRETTGRKDVDGTREKIGGERSGELSRSTGSSERRRDATTGRYRGKAHS